MEPIQRNILLNPGPATTTDTVKMAQVVPDICPREAEFGNLMRDMARRLTKIVHQGDLYECIFFGGSGTAVMDASINSIVPLGKKIIILVNGAYGDRMVRIAKAYGIDYEEIRCLGSQYPDEALLENSLRSDPNIAVVAMIHHETTTGILNPIAKYGAIAKRYGKVFLVDAISTFAGIPLDVVKANVDFLLGTSNKCIQGMAGLGFIIARKSELEKTKDYPVRSFYLNLWQQYAYFKSKGEMQFTPPVQTAYALNQAILEFELEGVEGRYKRYTENWIILRAGLKELGFRFLLSEEQESHILLTVYEPSEPGYTFEWLHDTLFLQGFTIYPGKIGEAKTFRLANMGAIDSDDIQRFLLALKNALSRLKV